MLKFIVSSFNLHKSYKSFFSRLKCLEASKYLLSSNLDTPTEKTHLTGWINQ